MSNSIKFDTLFPINKDLIITKYKSELVGDIIEIIPNDYLIVDSNGKKIKIEWDQIGNIIFGYGGYDESGSPFFGKENIEIDAPEGWSTTVGGTMYLGKNYESYQTFAGGMHATHGYQWSKWKGMEYGLGVDFYDFSNSIIFFPMYLKSRIFPLKFLNSYASVAVGYSFLPKFISDNIEDSKGGLFFNPSFGVRLPLREKRNLNLEFGFLHQRGGISVYEVDSTNGTSLNDINIAANRLSLKVLYDLNY